MTQSPMCLSMRAAVGLDQLVGGREERVEQGLDLLGADLGRERREADQIGEQYGHQATLR